MVGGFLGLAAVNTFAVLAVVFVARRVGEYAFIRPGREMLFSLVDTETKYKAKNLIDVPVYRGGDALAAQVKTALEAGGLSTAGVALLGAGLAAAWALNGWWLGRRREAAALVSWRKGRNPGIGPIPGPGVDLSHGYRRQEVSGASRRRAPGACRNPAPERGLPVRHRDSAAARVAACPAGSAPREVRRQEQLTLSSLLPAPSGPPALPSNG